MSSAIVVLAQAPAGKQAAPPRRVLSVTTTAWPDGGEIPLRNASRGGENKSPAFEFHWNLGTNPSTAPEDLQFLCRDFSRR